MGRAPGRQATEMGSGGPCVCLSLQTPRRPHSPGVGGPLRRGVGVPVSASPCRPPGDLTAPGRPPEPRSGSKFPLPHHHYFQEVGMSLFPSRR